MAFDPWENADAASAEDASAWARLDLKELSRYSKKASELIVPFTKLADALETKKIAIYAQRIQKRVDDVEELREILGEARGLIDALESEHEELCESLASTGAERAPGLLLKVQKLGAYQELLTLGEKLLRVESRIGEQDEDRYIDWTLEDYVGGEATIAGRLQEDTPGLLIEDGEYMGTRAIYGVLSYYGDEDYTADRINEILEEQQ